MDAAVTRAVEISEINLWRKRRRMRGRGAAMLLHGHHLLSKWPVSWYGLGIGAIVAAIVIAVVIVPTFVIFRPLSGFMFVVLLLVGGVAAYAGLAGGESIVRRLAISKRHGQELDVFVEKFPALASLPIDYVRAARESIAAAYGVKSELIRSTDGFQSLSAFMFTGSPLAHEVLADSMRRLGLLEQYRGAAERLVFDPNPDAHNVGQVIVCLHHIIFQSDRTGSEQINV